MRPCDVRAVPREEVQITSKIRPAPRVRRRGCLGQGNADGSAWTTWTRSSDPLAQPQSAVHRSVAALVDLQKQGHPVDRRFEFHAGASGRGHRGIGGNPRGQPDRTAPRFPQTHMRAPHDEPGL